MFNGYNDSTLISYEFNQEREKKLDNVSKYTYGYDGGAQSTPTHPNNRQSEFWSGKPNLVGIHNVVKCSCAGCYPIAENQSYQIQSTHHRPWLPKTHSVPLNGSNECKLPAYQWDNTLNQICYSDSNILYGQENEGKHSYYRQFQNPNQPGVIISANKQKSEMGYQNGVRQSVMCNPGYDLTKRVNGRNHYNGDKYSPGAHSVNQIPRLPVEPYTKAVPSNLNQNRVPSTGLRKANSPQCDLYSGTKVFPENYHSGLSPVDPKNSGIQVDYPYYNRDSDLYRSDYTDIKRNNAAVQNRKDFPLTQTNFEQHYGRSKHPENMKGCEMFYPNLEKSQMESCIQRIENDGMNCLARSMTVCDDLRYADERPQAFPYQNNASCRNYIRPEYSQFNSQCVSGFQETDQNQCRILPQQVQSCDQQSQGNNGCFVDSQKCNPDKVQSYGRTELITDAQPRLNYLETIRSEELTKNGTNKISPLRLLRKKKLVTPPQEISSAPNTLENPTLDVRKFWSTWAEEEDENVSPTPMVVLDCQNIDPEQAKLLNFCETDHSRPINFENVLLKNSDWIKNNTENVRASEEAVCEQDKLITIPTQTEPVIKNGNKVTPEFETLNKSPKKYKTPEHRKKKIEEVIDKWTEKKFDFLKKSEDSKAAEMVRYEEEKRKIFERRLSFQQIGVKKTENSQEDSFGFEENSQSNSPEEQSTSDLPTCEYRRNKFLDYSEVITNGCKDNQKIQSTEENQSMEANILKKEESDIKQEAGTPLEMHDILKKITEINFQEMKSENGLESLKKGKKTKKKKLDQLETDAKADLKLETVSKPTIKFSIQKSHDLKISFKVLNKKYEEEVQSEETKPIEDVNTEFITLKYKSIQNGGKLSDLKKKKGKLRRKKHATALKLKKSKYMEEERDPIPENDNANTFSTDDFQVQETVDSAKIKLTFKRHKNNLEKEYKVDGDGVNVDCKKHEKKFKKSKKHKIHLLDIRSPRLEPDSVKQDLAIVSSSECNHENHLESTKEYSESSSTSHFSCSTDKKETNENLTGPFETTLSEKRLCELTVEESNCKINDKQRFELMSDCDEGNGSDEKYCKFSLKENVEEAISKSSEDRKTKEEIQEISLDFIRTINSPDIETNRETDKTEEIENRDSAEGWNKNNGIVIESTNKNHSSLESSYDPENNLVCLQIKADLKPVSSDEKNDSLKSDITKKNIFGEEVSKIWEMESELRNLEDHLGSKPLEDNFEKYDSLKDKKENIEFETPKVGNEAKIELEDVLKMVDPEENVKSEVDKVSDMEHPELPKLKISNPLKLNENIHQSERETTNCSGLQYCNEIDQSPEFGQITTEEKGLGVESGQSNKDSVIENKSDLENQSINLSKIDNEEFKISVKDQSNTGDLSDDEQKTFFFQSEPNSAEVCEKENELHDSGSGDVRTSKFRSLDLANTTESEKIESDDALSLKSDISNSDPKKDNNFIDQIESENIDFGSDLLDENCEKNTIESEIECIEKLTQKGDLFNVENESLSSDIDQLICTPDRINEKSIKVTEQEMEVICDSQNPPQAPPKSFFQAVEFINNNSNVKSSDEKIIKESQVELDLLIQNNQSVENISQVDYISFSQLNKEIQAKELSDAQHFENVHDIKTPETCNPLPDDLTICETTIADMSNENKFEISNEVLPHLESNKENCEEAIFIEKSVEDDEQSEMHLLNEKSTLIVEAQEKIIAESNDQPDVFSMSSVDDSGVNFSTDSTEIILIEERNFVNASPQLNTIECNSLEISLNQDSELEDGEIVDNSSDDLELAEQTASFEFKIQKPIRRHSVNFCSKESPMSSSLCQRKFKKSKSCPPRLEFKTFEMQFNISVKDIPLPIGPPPLCSCLNFSKTAQEAKVEKEVRKNLEVPLEEVLKTKEKDTVQELPCGSPFGAIELQNCRNPSPPCSDAFGTPRSKIKFTLTKRSRFSKIGLHPGKPKFFEKLEPNVSVSKKDVEQKKPKPFEKLDVIKSTEKPEIKFNDILEKTDLNMGEFSEEIHSEISTQEETQPKIFELTEVPIMEVEVEVAEPTGTPKEAEMEGAEPAEKPEKEMEVAEPTGTPKVEIMEPFQGSESKDVILSEAVDMEVIDPVENIGLEILEPSISIINETEIDTNKIRTPDFIEETVENTKKSQIAEVPNTVSIHFDDKDQKSDFEVESLCEDANVEIVNVMNDFMRDEFYEDIPTSEDLPNGDSVDEKVNDDKFRNIMQNCLENAKKFLNVGTLKLFSCSVEDLVELDNEENEPTANHISRDVLLTSCEDTNDDLSLNEKFQPVDISMEFVPSDVCPEILPVDNWPYLEEEVPSSPLKTNEADMILENTISEVVPNRKRAAKEPENHKRFRRKSLIDDDETNCSKISANSCKRVDQLNGFLSYAKLNGIDKPNESLKCRLSLEKLTKSGVEFLCPQGNFPKKMKDIKQNEKLNYKSPLWQPKVMLIRISEKEVRRFKKNKIKSRTDENLNSLPIMKRPKSDQTRSKSEEKDIVLSIPSIDSINKLIATSPELKKHKPRFRNLHTKAKSERGQIQPKEIETALSELFSDFDEQSKNAKFEKTDKNVKITDGKQKSERDGLKYHTHKDKHDNRERRREGEREHHRHKEKRKHQQSKQEERKRRKSDNFDNDKKLSVSKRNSGQKEAWVCEVCGFNDATERVAHIKNHPFHCQSCHLAFKTEAYFTNHLKEMHKDIRNQHHCLLCELSFDTEEEYQRHLVTREHSHLEAVEKNTINTLFTLLTGAPCPVLGLVEMKPEWLPNQPGTVHFYHQATPLSLALQYLKMQRDLTSHSEVSKLHSN